MRLREDNMKQLKENSKLNIYKFICSVLLCSSLMLNLSMIGKIASSETPWESIGSLLFGLAVAVLGLYEAMFFIYNIKKTNNKFYYANLAYAIYLVIVGILISVFGKNTFMFPLLCALFLIVPITKNVVSIVRNPSRRNIIGKVILELIIHIILAINIVYIGEETPLAYISAGLLPGTVLAIICLANICVIAFSNFNSGILKKIIQKTYAGEVIFGLVLLIVAFAMVIMMVEPSIVTYWDALWYCFMLVTTIGFGDMTSVSLLGRILSVVLGIYGIVVVSIVTSVIVNFYNEVKNDDKEEPVKAEENAPDLPQETPEENTDEVLEESSEEPEQEAEETKEE